MSMSSTSAVLLLVLCALLATAVVALDDPVQLHNGFTVITSSSGLWTFTNQTGLTTFQPQYKVALPFNSMPNQTAVAATSGGITEGGFLVISQTSVALGEAPGPKGEPSTYQVIHEFSPLNFTLLDVAFSLNTPLVAAVGMTLQPTARIALFHSSNAGRTWSYKSGALTLLTAKASLSMTGDSHGAAAEGNNIYVTRDHGQVWTLAFSDDKISLDKVVVHDRSLAVAFGISFALDMAVMRVSNDSGRNWTNASPPPLGAKTLVTGFAFVNRNEWVLAASNGQIWKTSDSGASWSISFTPNVTVDGNVSWTDLALQPGWGSLMAVGGNRIAVSSDRGATWTLSPVIADVNFVRVVGDIPRPLRPGPQPPSHHDDDDDAVGLALGLIFGLGGGLLILGGIGYVVYRRYYKPRSSYTSINA